jgi:hypothetical protein
MKYLIALFCLPLMALDFTGATLRGSPAFKVLLEDIAPAGIEAGLDKQELTTAVELRCRMAGMPIRPSSDFSDFIGILYVWVLPIQEHYAGGKPTGDYAFAMSVEFVQLVSLQRDPSISSLGTTWSKVTIVTTPREGAARFCRETLVDLVDQFLNAYLAQNPKRQPSNQVLPPPSALPPATRL